jgi:hypothetical protein
MDLFGDSTQAKDREPHHNLTLNPDSAENRQIYKRRVESWSGEGVRR